MSNQNESADPNSLESAAVLKASGIIEAAKPEG